MYSVAVSRHEAYVSMLTEGDRPQLSFETTHAVGAVESLIHAGCAVESLLHAGCAVESLLHAVGTVESLLNGSFWKNEVQNGY